MITSKLTWAWICVFFGLIIGCQPDQTPPPTSQANSNQSEQFSSVTPTHTPSPAPTVTLIATSSSTATSTPRPTLTQTPTVSPTPQATPTTNIEKLVNNLERQGFTPTQTVSPFVWAGATFHLTFYTPPPDSPAPANLLLYKTVKGQTTLLKRIIGQELSLDTSVQSFDMGWQPLTALLPFAAGDIAMSEAPHHFYCAADCEPGSELVGYFWLDEVGKVSHIDPFIKFTGWTTLNQGDTIYHLVTFHDGNFPFGYIYTEIDGEIISRLKLRQFLGNNDALLDYRLPTYTLKGETVEGWQDLNGDGLPEIVILTHQSGSGLCVSELMVIQIQTDGTLKRIETPACTWQVEDVDNDGVAELLVGLQRQANALDCSGARSCWSTEVYRWDGDAYVLADYTDFADYYVSRALKTAFNLLEKNDSLTRYTDGYHLEEIMLIHQLLGREADGLAIFDSFTNPACYSNKADNAPLLQQLRTTYGLPPDSEAPCPSKYPVCTLTQTFGLTEQPFDTLAHLNFIDEEILAVGGWVPHSAPYVPPTPGPTPTPVYGDFVVSPRHTYYRAALNVTEGRITSTNLTVEPLNNPCGDTPCSREVVAQSPDGRWQILHVLEANSRAVGGVEGVWLVSADQTNRLGEPYLPTTSFWQWSADGSLLWYQRIGTGYGLTADTLLVELDSPVVVHPAPVETSHPLNFNTWRAAFSPFDKRVYTVHQFEYVSDHFEWPATERHTLVVTAGLTSSTTVDIIPNLTQIIWNEATYSFWQIFIVDEGVLLEEMETEQALLIPITFFEKGKAIEDSSILIELISPAKMVIAPAKEQVAVNFGGKPVLLFTCGLPPQAGD